MAGERCRDLLSELLRSRLAPVRAEVQRVELDMVEPELLGELLR
jgi:hypothetical protein